MKELADILSAFDELAPGTDAALATVVRVVGSSYRSPGARLLVTGDGGLIGQVSGGCLERDVLQRAGGVIASKQPMLVRYETGSDPENGTGYSLGCGGAIDILIEPINTPAGLEMMRWLAGSRSANCVIATVISKRHPTVPLGTRMMVDVSDRPDDVRSPLMAAILQRAIAVLPTDRSALAEFQTADGPVEVFFDCLKPPVELLVFGSGNDAVPLVVMGRSLGWRVTVVDVGSSPADANRVWTPDRIVRCRIEQVEQQIKIRDTTAAVVMTHNFGHDRQLICWLATQPVRYLGMLGPRHRTDQLLGDLQPGTLRAPVGLDIGAETPEEVALSIVAEITAVLRHRDGGALSQRPGPIHSRGNGTADTQALTNNAASEPPAQAPLSSK